MVEAIRSDEKVISTAQRELPLNMSHLNERMITKGTSVCVRVKRADKGGKRLSSKAQTKEFSHALEGAEEECNKSYHPKDNKNYTISQGKERDDDSTKLDRKKSRPSKCRLLGHDHDFKDHLSNTKSINRNGVH